MGEPGASATGGVLPPVANAPGSPFEGEPTLSTTNDDLKARLTRILIDEVGPALQLDGSAIEVAGIEEGFAQLRLGQVCAGCPSTLMVLIHGLESELRQRFPEIRGVEVLP